MRIRTALTTPITASPRILTDQEGTISGSLNQMSDEAYSQVSAYVKRGDTLGAFLTGQKAGWLGFAGGAVGAGESLVELLPEGLKRDITVPVGLRGEERVTFGLGMYRGGKNIPDLSGGAINAVFGDTGELKYVARTPESLGGALIGEVVTGSALGSALSKMFKGAAVGLTKTASRLPAPPPSGLLAPTSVKLAAELKGVPRRTLEGIVTGMEKLRLVGGKADLVKNVSVESKITQDIMGVRTVKTVTEMTVKPKRLGFLEAGQLAKSWRDFKPIGIDVAGREAFTTKTPAKILDIAGSPSEKLASRGLTTGDFAGELTAVPPRQYIKISEGSLRITEPGITSSLRGVGKGSSKSSSLIKLPSEIVTEKISDIATFTSRKDIESTFELGAQPTKLLRENPLLVEGKADWTSKRAKSLKAKLKFKGGEKIVTSIFQGEIKGAPSVEESMGVVKIGKGESIVGEYSVKPPDTIYQGGPVKTKKKLKGAEFRDFKPPENQLTRKDYENTIIKQGRQTVSPESVGLTGKDVVSRSGKKTSAAWSKEDVKAVQEIYPEKQVTVKEPAVVKLPPLLNPETTSEASRIIASTGKTFTNIYLSASSVKPRPVSPTEPTKLSSQPKENLGTAKMVGTIPVAALRRKMRKFLDESGLDMLAGYEVISYPPEQKNVERLTPRLGELTDTRLSQPQAAKLKELGNVKLREDVGLISRHKLETPQRTSLGTITKMETKLRQPQTPSIKQPQSPKLGSPLKSIPDITPDLGLKLDPTLGLKLGDIQLTTPRLKQPPVLKQPPALKTPQILRTPTPTRTPTIKIPPYPESGGRGYFLPVRRRFGRKLIVYPTMTAAEMVEAGQVLVNRSRRSGSRKRRVKRGKDRKRR